MLAMLASLAKTAPDVLDDDVTNGQRVDAEAVVRICSVQIRSCAISVSKCMYKSPRIRQDISDRRCDLQILLERIIIAFVAQRCPTGKFLVGLSIPT